MFFSVDKLKTFLLKEASKIKFDSPPKYIEKKIKVSNILLNGNTPATWNNLKEFEYSSDDISLHHLFGTSQIQHSTFLAIVGPSGSGKTTLIKQLLKKYSEKKHLFGAEYVFYIQFSDIGFNCESNFLEFLASNLPYRWLISTTVSAKVLKQAFKTGKVCIIIDNLMVENIKFPQATFDSDALKTISNGETHLINILSGKAFPGATVLVTFQPSQLLKLPIAIKPDYFVNILGITPNGKEELIKEISTDHSDAIMMYINTYPTLNKFCQLPANCFAFIHVTNAFISLKNNSIPLLCFPITQILVASLTLLVSDKGLTQSRCDLSFVVERSGKNFPRKTLNFDTFQSSNKHASQVFELFLQLVPPETFLSGFNVCFDDVSQDFFVALFLLYFDNDSKNFNEYLTNYLGSQLLNANQEFKNITKFLFGLCNDVTFDYIKELLPSCTLSCDKPKKLTDFVIDKFCSVKANQVNWFSTLLFVSSLAFELQCDCFREKLANTCIPDKIRVIDDCCVSDLAAFFYVIQARKTEMSLCGVSCFTGENKKFFSEAKKLLTKINYIQ